MKPSCSSVNLHGPFCIQIHSEELCLMTQNTLLSWKAQHFKGKGTHGTNMVKVVCNGALPCLLDGISSFIIL